ncbi:hypothetical protein HY628_01005, partial [Candidatus Uhrbacteria bacterium]|nr:hypothetical protein [Candidatus Uhrbacteria bacterium]
MTRILLLTMEYPPDRGGVARYLASLHEGLPGVTIQRARFWSGWPAWLPTAGETIRKVRQEKIEMLAVSHLLPMGYVAMLVKFFLRKPFVVFIHGLDLLRATQRPWKRWWAARILRSASQIIA